MVTKCSFLNIRVLHILALLDFFLKYGFRFFLRDINYLDILTLVLNFCLEVISFTHKYIYAG